MNAQAIVNDFKSEVSRFADFKLLELREAASLLRIKERGHMKKTELLSRMFDEILNTSVKEGTVSIYHQKQKTVALMNKPSEPRSGTKSHKILKYMRDNPSLTKKDVVKDLQVEPALVRRVMLHYMNADK